MSKKFLSGFLSVGVGGEAEVEIIRTTAGLTYYRGDIILGRGTNTVASDLGTDARVLVMRNIGAEFDGVNVTAESGTSLSALARATIKRGLGGLEWAVGIPGSVGGAVVGNAGAFGGAVGDSVSEVKVLTERGIVCIGADKLHFSYRKTDGLPEGIITGVVFRLKRADPVMLAECAAGYDERRRSSQPTGRSAGSTFLACNGISAGYYIERAGLKGTRIGGARVSDKHANFIIVDGGCANDIRLLTDLIKLKVYAEFGVRLKEEINYIGEF